MRCRGFPDLLEQKALEVTMVTQATKVCVQVTHYSVWILSNIVTTSGQKGEPIAMDLIYIYRGPKGIPGIRGIPGDEGPAGIEPLNNYCI